MGTALPDIKELASWEEAFKYPIATTRQIERQLQNNVAANKERLRTLVGSSYRDLLGTAEQIIQLDEDLQQTEHLLGDVSLECNFESINRKAAQLAQKQKQHATLKERGRRLAAQLTLLQRCQRCLPRMFRNENSILSIAKVLAVSRLLHKSISQGEDAPVVLETIRKRLASTRQQLLTRIDTVLTNPKSAYQHLSDAICAFCIVTSSASRDAVRHFQALQLEEIQQVSNLPDLKRENVVDAFSSYLRSLRTIKQLLGRHLSEAFRELRSQPLLQTPDIQALESLGLGDIQQFLPSEILTFVPWIKHEDAWDTEVSSITAEWSRGALEVWHQGLSRAVKSIVVTLDLLEFRYQVFQVWLPQSASTPTHSAFKILDGLRNVFNSRMKDLLSEKTALLSRNASAIQSALDGQDGASLVVHNNIWDHDLVTATFGKGALSYKRRLTDSYSGHSQTIEGILASFGKWIKSMRSALEDIDHARKTRWTDLVEEDEDDEDRAEVIEKSLQKDDPQLYEEEHASLLKAAIWQFETQVQAAVQGLVEQESNVTVELKAVFLLRIIRGVYQQLSAAMPEQNLDVIPSVVQPMHHLIASKIVSDLVSSSTTSGLFPASQAAKRRERAKLKALFHLWDGSPSLPTHPSPRIFKLLQRLVASMAEMGSDIWFPDAVDVLKQAVRADLLSRGLLDNNGGISKRLNGDVDEAAASAEENIEEGRVVAIQALFDALYLDHALNLHTSNVEQATDQDHDNDRQDQTSSDDITYRPKQAARSYLDLDPDDTEHAAASTITTLETRARDYWHRTYLLFGLLTPSQ